MKHIMRIIRMHAIYCRRTCSFYVVRDSVAGYGAQEAGWLWSGGVALDTPGDQFVKIRHRSAPCSPTLHMLHH